MDILETDDILLSTFFIVKGVKLLGIKQDRPQHFLFQLSEKEKCLKLEKEYLSNAEAPAHLLFATREMLINQIKNRIRGQEV